MWFYLFLIFIFILINGFFAAAEIAVVSMRRSRIKQLMDEGELNAKVLNNLREKPDRFLATIQIGVTISGGIASAIGGVVAVEIEVGVGGRDDVPVAGVSFVEGEQVDFVARPDLGQQRGVLDVVVAPGVAFAGH